MHLLLSSQPSDVGERSKWISLDCGRFERIPLSAGEGSGSTAGPFADTGDRRAVGQNHFPVKREMPVRSQTLLFSVCVILIALLTPSICLAQAQVQNVRVRPTSDFKVEVTYDMQGLGDRTATVRLFYSRDKGRSFQEAQKIEGDVGRNIGEGQGHRIVWDPEDEVGAVRDEEFVFKVEAKLTESIIGGQQEEGPIPPPPPLASGEALVFLTTDQDGLSVELFAGAKVVQQGPLGARSPFQAILKPGHYRLHVTKAEHHLYEEGFELTSRKPFQKQVHLEEAYGWLDLTVVPENAHIVVDDVPIP